MCELDPGIIDAEGRLHYKMTRLRAVAMPTLEMEGRLNTLYPPELWMLYSD